MRKDHPRLIILCISGLLAIVLFGLFVSPGLYRYDQLEQKYPVRINRLTGATRILIGGEWVEASSKNAAYFSQQQQQESGETGNTIMLQMSSLLQRQLDSFRQELNQDIQKALPTPSPSYETREYGPLASDTKK